MSSVPVTTSLSLNIRDQRTENTMETSLDIYLAALLEEIPSLVKEANHSEIWGVDLVKGKPEHIKAILIKVHRPSFDSYMPSQYI